MKCSVTVLAARSCALPGEAKMKKASTPSLSIAITGCRRFYILIETFVCADDL